MSRIRRAIERRAWTLALAILAILGGQALALLLLLR